MMWLLRKKTSIPTTMQTAYPKENL